MDLTALAEGELALISRTFLFQNQPGDCVEDCLRQESCGIEEFRKGAELYTPVVFRRSLGILLDGTVRVSKGTLMVSLLRPGDLFGAAALFTDRAFETALTARTACRVLFLPQKLMRELLDRYPALAANYIVYLSGRIHFLNEKIERLLVPTAREKLARHLLDRAKEEREPECSATELAKHLDVSRASLYRAFAELEAGGAIERRGKCIRIISEEKLIISEELL